MSNLSPTTNRYATLIRNEPQGDPQSLHSEKHQQIVPRANVKRPPGDVRTAEQIINDNPILKSLDSHKTVDRDLLYSLDGKLFVVKPTTERNVYFELAFQQVGNWTASNHDPESRADAAYNAARVLNWIDSSITADGKSRGTDVDNGVLEGFTHTGYAIDGTPAFQWQAFTQEGYGALAFDRRLDKHDSDQIEVGPHPEWSDRYLIGLVKMHFREFATKASDDYVNVNELKIAAGLHSSSRTFSPEAQEVALEILSRPDLSRALDIGVNAQGGPGYKDGRFDMENIDHLYVRASDISPLQDATVQR